MAGPDGPAIKIEGYEQLRRDLRTVSADLPKALGRAHKEVGRKIITLLDPPPIPETVGAGAGAAVRPSATARELLLRVGFMGREDARSQWGRRPVQPFESGRPFIIGTALEHEDYIRAELLDEITKQLEPAFAKAE